MSLQKGLVGHWTCDTRDTSGGTLYDRSAYDNHGSFLTAPSTDQSGILGESYLFDQSNSESIDAGSSDSLNLDGTSFTFSVWLKPISFSSTPSYIFDKGDTFTTDEHLHIGFRDSSTLTFAFYADDIDYNQSFNTGQWYHTVYRFDSSNNEQAIFVNGSLVATRTSGGALSNTDADPLIIGQGLGNYLDGYADDIRVYNRALSASEVNALYQMREQRTQSNDLGQGLVGHWTLDGESTSNGTIYDSTPYDTNPVISGSVNTGDSAIVDTGTTFGGGYASTTDYQDLPTGDDVFTVTTFFKLDTLPSNSAGSRADIWSWGEASPNNYNAVDLYDDNISWYNYSNDPNNDISIDWNLGDWYFYYSKWDGSTSYTGLFDMSGVINEREDGLTGVNVSENGGFSIARDYGRDTSYFEGTIDDLRVYNRALSRSEIIRLYNKRQ